MGEVIYGIDFRSKKRMTPDQAILDLAELILLQLEPADVVYDSLQGGWVGPEKDPA